LEVVKKNTQQLFSGISFEHKFVFMQLCHFLFLEKKKVTKENSSETRSLRAFSLANATPHGL